jgi:hypothetical protein
MARAKAACGISVKTRIMPELESVMAELLGKREHPWFEYLSDAVTRSPVI